MSTLFMYMTFSSHQDASHFWYILKYSALSIIIPMFSTAFPLNLHSPLYQQYLTLSILLQSYSIPSSLRTTLNSHSITPIEISRFHSEQTISFIFLNYQSSSVITVVIPLSCYFFIWERKMDSF